MHVGAEIVPQAQPERGAHAFFLCGDSAQFDPRAARGFLTRKAAPDQLLRVALKMKGKLFVHLTFEARARGCCAKPRP